jgi:hypothetical protein
MRFRRGTSIVAAALVLALASSAPAAAQQSPTLGAPPSPDVTVQTQPTTTTGGGGGLKTWQEALIFAAGIILIGGIAVAIMTDARERARRIGHGGPATEPAGTTHRHGQQSKQRARQKAKAARAQRRKNR